MAHEHKIIDQGFIYKIESPSGKVYIGQVVEYINRKFRGSYIKEKKGIEGRWKQHVNSSKSKERINNYGCSYIHRAILKYGPDKMKVSQLMKVDSDKLDLFEEFYIKMYKSLTPDGYNLQTGGTNTKHSKITCQKRSASLKKLFIDNPEKREVWKNAKLGKVQKNKRKCKNPKNQDLPKYIYHRSYNRGKYEGYRVEHPKGSKTFSKSCYSMEERLNQAIDYINELEK